MGRRYRAALKQAELADAKQAAAYERTVATLKRQQERE